MNCVYQIENAINNKKYIGWTCDYENRTKEHFNLRSRCIALRNAIKKHGKENFNGVILLSDPDERYIKLMEIYYIAKFRTKAPNGYNLTDGGEGKTGYKASEDTRKKMSMAGIGNTRNKGKKVSGFTKKKMSLAHLGNTHTEETKINMSLVQMGKKHTEETKKKISLARTGNQPSEATKKKLSLAKIGHLVSEATKKKISLAMMGNKNNITGMPKNNKGII